MGMGDLLRLDSCRPQGGSPVWLGDEVTTPLVWQEWDKALRDHPDQRLRAYITNGIRYGFRLGFEYGSPCRPTRKKYEVSATAPGGGRRLFGTRVWGGTSHTPIGGSKRMEGSDD